MTIEERVSKHYEGDALLEAIRAGVAALKKDTTTVTVDDLSPVDEFHIGGRPATTELCDRLGIDDSSLVLDVGCGIGGSSRFVASTYGCRTVGIDLTPSYIEVARTLSEWTGLGERCSFDVGSALNLPYDDDTFDRAIQLHVGMNIEDKTTLLAEIYRVIKPGGRVAIYDVMRKMDDTHEFPVPWASDPSTSFVAAPSAYRMAMEAAGFSVTGERDRSQFATEFFAALQARSAAAEGPPPLGLHVIMGPDAPVKIGHMVAAVKAGTLAPCEVIGEKPARGAPDKNST